MDVRIMILLLNTAPTVEGISQSLQNLNYVMEDQLTGTDILMELAQITDGVV
jgi:hypothetical protein